MPGGNARSAAIEKMPLANALRNEDAAALEGTEIGRKKATVSGCFFTPATYPFRTSVTTTYCVRERPGNGCFYCRFPGFERPFHGTFGGR